MDLVENFVVKVAIYDEINKCKKICSNRGQSHSLTLEQGLKYYSSFNYLLKSWSKILDNIPCRIGFQYPLRIMAHDDERNIISNPSCVDS